MEQSQPAETRKIMIASASPLFGQGLEKVMRRQEINHQAEFKHTSNLADTLETLETWQPDLVVVDYDDHKIDRRSFLDFFVESQRSMQVMLVSLRANEAVVVYDRRVLTSDQAQSWFGVE